MLPQSLSILGISFLLLCSACGRKEDYAARLKTGDALGDHVLEAAADFRLSTSELGSRVVLIHFFEAGSEECRAQANQVKGLWFPHRAAGMTVLGICPETDAKEVQATVMGWGLPYPAFVDPERRFMSEFAPREYPWNVVVGRDGKILLSEKGGWDRVQAAVNEAIQVKVGGPDHVRVQHILIAFQGSLPGKEIDRSKEDAAKLAAEVLERAKAGEEFGDLVKNHSSDTVPGIYRIANYNVEADDDRKETERGLLVQSFGDVSFSLEVGAVGIAEHHPIKSPYGWHVIKRLG